MRERGDLEGGLATAGAGAAEEGATATDSVAACIWGGLRRQYAIAIHCLHGRSSDAAQSCYLCLRPPSSAILDRKNARFWTFRAHSNAKPAPAPVKSDQAGTEFVRARIVPC